MSLCDRLIYGSNKTTNKRQNNSRNSGTIAVRLSWSILKMFSNTVLLLVCFHLKDKCSFWICTDRRNHHAWWSLPGTPAATCGQSWSCRNRRWSCRRAVSPSRCPPVCLQGNTLQALVVKFPVVKHSHRLIKQSAVVLRFGSRKGDALSRRFFLQMVLIFSVLVFFSRSGWSLGRRVRRSCIWFSQRSSRFNGQYIIFLWIIQDETRKTKTTFSRV